MADTKITALAAITTVAPANDLLPIVDVNDHSMAASGTTKNITVNQILGAGGTATLASATITGAATVGTTLGVTGAATVGTTLGVTGGATVGGTLGVTGASTFTGAVVCNGAVTLGDAVGDAITATGSFTSYTGQTPSAIRAAASDYAAVSFDGATANTRITSTLTGQNIGTGDFSIWQRVRIPAANPSNSFAYAAINNVSNTSFDSSGTFGINQEASGAIMVFGYVATVFTVAFTVTGVITNYGGQIVDLVLTRSTVGGTSTLTLYINGTSVGSSTAAVASQSVTTGFLHSGVVAGKQPEHRCYRSVLFNRALSASDVTELITTGVNPADQWGTQTAAYTSDFSAGTDSWSAARGTAAGNIDGISGVDNTLRLTVDTTASNTHLAFLNPVPGLLAGKRYRVGFNYFITAANATMNGLALWQLSPSVQISTVQSVTGAWTSITPVEFVSGETRLAVLGAAGGNVNFTGNGTDTFYLHSFVLTRIGAIVDLDFTVGTGYQATDRSTNALHGTLFNGVEFTQPKQVAVLYATTNTNGNQQMLGTLAIPTNAVIEDIIVNSTGSATVSIGNASAGTQIVNGASVVSGRQKLTIATPFSTTGNLWVNSNSTDTLQFTILYTVAA